MKLSNYKTNQELIVETKSLLLKYLLFKITVKWAQIHDKHHKDVLDIIYEDDDIIVINKPVGLLSIATNDEKINTVYYMVMNYLKQKNQEIIFL